jgi:hypothetical protein
MLDASSGSLLRMIDVGLLQGKLVYGQVELHVGGERMASG